MTEDVVRPLYDPTLVRHARAPRLRAPPPSGAKTFDGHNRICGDRLHLHLGLDEGLLGVRFEGEGCALSLGSASALCEAVDRCTLDKARAIVVAYRDALAADPNAEALAGASLAGDLGVFLAARAFSSRLGCVRLAPETMLAALASLASHSVGLAQ